MKPIYWYKKIKLGIFKLSIFNYGFKHFSLRLECSWGWN